MMRVALFWELRGEKTPGKLDTKCHARIQEYLWNMQHHIFGCMLKMLVPQSGKIQFLVV